MKVCMKYFAQTSLSITIFQTPQTEFNNCNLYVVTDDFFQVEKLETLVQGLWLYVGCLHLLHVPLFMFHMIV